VSTLDDIVAETIADRIFAGAREALVDDVDDAYPMPAHQYFARKAFNDAESAAKLVEALSKRCAGGALRQGDDPALVEGVKRLAQTASIHCGHARAAALAADGDPVFGPLAAAPLLVRAAPPAPSPASLRVWSSALALGWEHPIGSVTAAGW